MQSYEKIGKLPILAMLKIRMQPLFTSFFCLKTPSLHFFFTIFIRFYSIIIMYYRNSMILRDKKRRLKQNVYALFTQNLGHNRRFQATDYNLEVTNNRMKSPQMTEYKYAKWPSERKTNNQITHKIDRKTVLFYSFSTKNLQEISKRCIFASQKTSKRCKI